MPLNTKREHQKGKDGLSPLFCRREDATNERALKRGQARGLTLGRLSHGGGGGRWRGGLWFAVTQSPRTGARPQGSS